MGTWRRPYAQSIAVIRREAGAAFAVVSAGLVVAWLGVHGRLADGFAGVAAAVAVIAAIYAVRLHFVGVFLNDAGLLVRTFTETAMVPWAEVACIDVLPAEDRPGLTAWVVTVHGEHVETPLIRVGARREPRPVVSVHLSGTVFDQALRELRAARSAAVRPHPRLHDRPTRGPVRRSATRVRSRDRV
ncbi:hypothetical protein [Hamadaea tsunoensis]|uniref:hypothetical protein n=1 Tax=Hamadaea tsunoensis TaxID=53368 RepID=UPI0012F72724|nr:hypothetical protein [Hamadaea tsunoensis]